MLFLNRFSLLARDINKQRRFIIVRKNKRFVKYLYFEVKHFKVCS